MGTIITFVQEAWTELKQVAWLSVPQMIASTWVVLALVAVIAVYIFSVDFLLRLFFSFII